MQFLHCVAPVDLARLARASLAAAEERDRKLAAQERQRQIARDDAVRAAHTVRLLMTMAHHQITPDQTEGATIRLGSLWFTAEADEWGRYRLVLITRCQDCHRVLYRDGFGSLQNLGAILAGMSSRDLVCTFCQPANATYLRSFDADVAYPERAE